MSFSKRVILGLSLVVAAGCGGGGGESSGVAKVTGGVQCEGGESPVVGLITYDSAGRYLGNCTGTLVSLTSVLTAAHCLPGVADVIVYTQTGRAIAAVEAAIHPNYSFGPNGGDPFDVAMVRLSSPLTIGPVPLLLSTPTAAGQSITVFGYGIDENGNNVKDRFQSGQALLKAGKMKIGGFIGGRFEAAFDDTQTAICQGDSGGPVTQTRDGITSLVGVISYTRNGCVSGSISGFVDIQRQSIVDFIEGFAPDISAR